MKALYFPRKDEVVAGDLPDPVAGEGEVVIAVRASGICHTDIDVMRANYGPSAFPVVPGHEYAGEVIEVGPGVVGLSIGDRVVVDPNIECGTCRACKRGWAHLCEHLGAYGVTVNGGFSEKSVVRASAVHLIGEMSYAMAALAEPMGCALNGFSPVADRLIDRALVIGAGPMGLLLGLALKVRGVAEVIMCDTDSARLDFARSHGLEALLAGTKGMTELRHGCDFAADATGSAAVAATLVDCVASGGAALFFGVCQQSARIEISPFDIFRRQLTLLGTHSLNHNIPTALETLRAIGPRVEGLITHRLPLEEVAATMAGHKPAGSLKIQWEA
ncbi:alcohol dehydrogenase catalytic domain-containing protein [Sedimentimonas flavescens]|uniref:Alcohol dehydrogenase catalytic domain-containing protein n=1 Tax=Sedimentimonas flavescens TaxID=2851012 RepID=A0ABT3A2I2_9RHOB|nr:alcohol dehydrogenase catalytic domain-containing protein [Sedimentimonas flavescens]MCV2880167.1 alcohol dehydrogenase catalytic domain-containing protein [Sedimentimonas flavescens]